MAKMMGSKEIYKNSPKLSRDEKGKMGVHDNKAAAKDPAEESGETETDEAKEGMPVAEHDMHARHNLDRHMMHAKHEHEHGSHKGGDKHDMHERHNTEIKAMLKKHDEELGGSDQHDAAMSKGGKD